MDSTTNDPDQLEPEQHSKNKVSRYVILGMILCVLAGIIAAAVLVGRANQADTAKTTEVIIINGAFNPGTIVVNKGQSVVWTNLDTAPHKIAAELADSPTNQNFNSQDVLQKGDTYTYTFQQTGTYHYTDGLNPQTVKGTVVVE